MTATLVGFLAAFLAGLLLMLVAALIDADDTRTVPVYVPRPAGSKHACWAEYDQAVLRAARAIAAAEMAAVRAEAALIGRPPAGAAMVHVGRELVAA